MTTQTLLRFALSWNDRVSFALTDTLAVKRVAFLDLARADTDNDAGNDDDRFDADFALTTGLVGNMLTDLVEALGGVQRAA